MESFINKGLKEEDHQVQQTGMVLYSLTSQLLMPYLLNNARWLTYDISSGEIEVWIEWFLQFCNLNECRSHLLGSPP